LITLSYSSYFYLWIRYNSKWPWGCITNWPTHC